MKHPVKIVRRITSKEETAHKKKAYPHAHRLANIAEIEHFGREQFEYINNKIQLLHKGHWAATHTPRHHIHISQELINLIPEDKRKTVFSELKIHEITEDIEMSKRRRK